VPSLLEAGYNLDFIDDEILAHHGRIEKRKLAVGNQDFSIVVLPGIERIPPATLAKLGEFAEGGGVLIATRRLPALTPGLVNQNAEGAEIRRLVEDLFKKPSAPGHFFPSENKMLEDELNRLYAPDVDLSHRVRDIGFIHRHTDAAEIYFIANTSNQPVQVGASFYRAGGNSAEWWNPFTGEVAAAEAWPSPVGGFVTKLDMEPYSSRLLVFGNRPTPGPSPSTGARQPEPLDLSRGWQVSFEGTARKIPMETLRSWTELEGLRFFSGRATYEKTVVVPDDFLQDGVQVNLNLGEPAPVPVQTKAHYQAWLDGPVREAAEVYVNGRRAGVIWHPPYELDITLFLHPGGNELRITVGNLAVNEMAGRPLPNYAQLSARYGERFTDQGMELVQPVPSGLTGPIRLIARRKPAAVPRVP
jgi:hypothetical protein